MTQRLTMENLRKWVPLFVLIGLVLFFTAVNPNFLSLRNFARIAISSSPALMVATGVTFVILMGSIDLSMEGTIAVCAVLFALMLNALGGSLSGAGWLAIPGALLIGAVLGAVNGLIHVKLKIPSFMASLSLGFVGIGLSLLITGGDRILIEDPIFRSLLTVRVGGFPLMAWAALACLLIAWFIQDDTTVGRNFYAVGGGEDLARASGLNTGRLRVTGFIVAGIFYALGAIFAVARLGIAETETGQNFMFVSITSVVVGGTSLSGGSGGVWNTLVGVLIVNVIGNGMVVVGLPDYFQDGVLGLLVIAAVYLSTDRRSLFFVK
ncbi:ABC transporter permease [Acetobacter oeni]|uniref:ABC transporter permease n=1 Tax=Acetobacter oeni TaxID=304077 RepID=A0A511XM71_9PROT|nr:ABC transporter permease [Acetobacter oeni]MBB3884059.1 ribose transport system permease protein [Acetobacter oeni]NHO19997.1 ABC transporter permease [Acetobacter oeni]GBR08514.1 ribose/xylose/arabinose/galactoside ABC transporter permease [Acetobacter oeni LMG 21952]GEN64045.1 ABC transporter permease [Acetobacter oeni]